MSMALASHAEPVAAYQKFDSLLAINGGSSSIRFVLYDMSAPLRRLLAGKVDRVGRSGTTLTAEDASGQRLDSRTIDGVDRASAVRALLDWLEMQPAFASVRAVGHRVVHGMAYSEPELVTPVLLDELRRITPYDPEHLPLEIALIKGIRQRHAALPQVACFDTAFHRAMPRVATLLPIPRRHPDRFMRVVNSVTRCRMRSAQPSTTPTCWSHASSATARRRPGRLRQAGTRTSSSIPCVTERCCRSFT